MGRSFGQTLVLAAVAGVAGSLIDVDEVDIDEIDEDISVDIDLSEPIEPLPVEGSIWADQLDWIE